MRPIVAVLALCLLCGCKLIDRPPPEEIVEHDEASHVLMYTDANRLPLDPELRQRYRPPRQFMGHAWGAGLTEIPELHPYPLTARTFYSRGKVTDLNIVCQPRGERECDTEATARYGIHQRTEGEGYHMLAEYIIAEDYALLVKLSLSGDVWLTPVLFQFCASFDGFLTNAPPDILDRLRFCGIRAYFDTETPEQLKKIADPRYVTNYDRVFRWLSTSYGHPDKYGKGAETIITTPDGQIYNARPRKMPLWRWCPPVDRQLVPYCESSIVLTYDVTLKRGVVVFATPPLWKFAHAQQNGGMQNEPLYQYLHGIGAAKWDRDCSGSILTCPRARAEKVPPADVQKLLEQLKIPESRGSSLDAAGK